MTGYYDLNLMPHVVTVRCPNCARAARFEFAEIVKIERKQDIAFFRHSDQFDYRVFNGSQGQNWHAAIYYPGLNGITLGAIEGLPKGYAPEDWAHDSVWSPSMVGQDIGSIVCHHCDLRKKTELSWPEDAYFQIAYKGKVLWAFNEDSAISLLDFIESEDRQRNKHKYQLFLRHIPSHFLHKHARGPVVKKLAKALENCGAGLPVENA